jgi:hypothetical protein
MGSTADYLALAAALEDHDRKERIANLIRAAWAFKLADRAMIDLTSLALRCGMPASEPSILAWVRQRVATYRQMTRGAA